MSKNQKSVAKEFVKAAIQSSKKNGAKLISVKRVKQ